MYTFSEDKELFEHLGRALYQSQLLEVTLAYIIRDLHLITGRMSGNDLRERLQDLRKILDSGLEKTLGALLVEVRKLGKLNDAELHLIKQAVEKRNEIVHEFFYKQFVVATAPDLRDVMLDDLKQSILIISAAYDLSKRIEKDIRANSNQQPMTPTPSVNPDR
jgi:hypothetical protein